MNPVNFLNTIGCSTKEAEAFLLILNESDGITALNLSKQMRLPRATIYGYLALLTEKGLIKKGLTENGSKYFAEPLETIDAIYDEQIREINNSKKQLKLYSEINKEYTNSYSPKFTLYDNSNATQVIFRDILRSGKKKIYWFWPAKDMLKTVPENVFEHFHEERLQKNIWLYVLWPESQKIDLNKKPFMGAKEMGKSLRKIKILTGKIDKTMGYGIYGNKVAFVSSKQENYGFIIDSKELAQTFKIQFDYFWSKSKRFN